MKKQTELAIEIQKLYGNGNGLSYRQIQKKLGCSKSVISYHLKQKTKNKVREYQRNRRRELSQKMWNYKSALGCSLCDENHPATLHFHHRDKESKVHTISYMVANKMNWENILDEIEKCDLLCANCHLKLHYKQDNRRVKQQITDRANTIPALVE